MANIPAQTHTNGEMGFRFDIAHQEMFRIVHELENIYNAFCFDENHESTGCEWLSVLPMAGLLCMNLGYEDRDELEDALKGDFEAFMKALPHLSFREASDGTLQWKINVDPPQDEWIHKILRFEIRDRSDLWRVVHKNTRACFRIPSIEFEISVDGVRTIDTIYNLISSAVFKLGDYIRGTKDLNQATEILQTVDALEMLLDVETPFMVELECVVGNSAINPADDRIKVEVIEGSHAAKAYHEGNHTDVE
eukprot:GDKJ01013496.1.p1 GENE.GDKJ01013496.1~~GDKJ01013496.1.p1  ORF type:complete len:250 (+),score=71.61 GDKJ01013496.1:47-796(+)